MRFTIYDSGKESVLLEDEIDYLNNFIDLQTARYHKEVNVNFIKDIQHAEAKVAPLLFIILLENAFKHGVEKTTDDSFIQITLTEDNHKISFVVENSFDPTDPTGNTGIGLQNLKERLNLLHPNTHQLIYGSQDNIFKAQLELYKKW